MTVTPGEDSHPSVFHRDLFVLPAESFGQLSPTLTVCHRKLIDKKFNKKEKKDRRPQRWNLSISMFFNGSLTIIAYVLNESLNVLSVLAYQQMVVMY